MLFLALGRRCPDVAFSLERERERERERENSEKEIDVQALLNNNEMLTFTSQYFSLLSKYSLLKHFNAEYSKNGLKTIDLTDRGNINGRLCQA